MPAKQDQRWALPSLYVGIAAYLLAILVPFLLFAESKRSVDFNDLIFAVYLAALWLRPRWHLWLSAGLIVLFWIFPLTPNHVRALLSGDISAFYPNPLQMVVGIVLLGALMIVAVRRRPES